MSRSFQNSRLAERVLVRYVLGADKATTPEGAKSLFDRYRKEHPATKKRPEDFYEKPEKDTAKKEVSKTPIKPAKSLFSPDMIKGLPESIEQKEKDPDKLFKAAEQAHQQQLKWLNQGEGLDKAIKGTVVRMDKGADANVDYDKPGPIIVIGPMKKQARAKEKVEADFGGDWSKLGDVVRASVAVDSLDDLDNVMSELKKTGLKLARPPKDRFAKPTEVGYRDVLMNVTYPNGHIGELQLHLKPVLKAKEAGHKFYEEVRTIESKAKKEGRKKLTDEEEATVQEANKKMKALYDKAFEDATSGKQAKTAASSSAKYYEYKDLPAYREPKEFPVVVTPKGENVIYTLEEFFRLAEAITKAEFDKLVKAQKK